MTDEKKQREHYAALMGIAADYELWAQASEGEELAANKKLHRSIVYIANKVKKDITNRLFEAIG